MDIFRVAFQTIPGGRVLDVATQAGGFVEILMDNLRSYTEIVGIDNNERAIMMAQDAFEQPNIDFLVMDAERLDFADESFDTVAISASFHHLANIERVLSEMMRVLKPGGHFIMAEMHRDGRTEAELTSIYLHHWVAEVDTALGRLHHLTLPRQAFVDHVGQLGCSHTEFFDRTDHASDPRDNPRIEHLEGLIGRVIKQAQAAENYPELKQQGDALLQRLHEVGAQEEPILVAIGRK